MPRSPRYRKRKHTWLGDILANPRHQMMMTVISSVLFTGLVFTGLLVFRYSAKEDLLSEGQRLMAEQKVATAKETLVHLVKRYPKSYEGHLLLGKAYLALDERVLAEEQFTLAAGLKGGKSKSGLAQVAMAELAIVHKEYANAEKILLSELKKREDNPSKELKQALYGLYNNWGDYILGPEEVSLEHTEEEADKKENSDVAVNTDARESKKADKVIKIYERALLYVQTSDQENRITGKLTDLIDQRVEAYNKQNKYEETIPLLKKSIELERRPETMLKIAYAYDKVDKLDNSIKWYRKAYSARPDTISMQLSQALMKKAAQLKKDGKTKEANALISEAEAVVRKAKLPLDELYPVEVSDISISSDVDNATSELLPKVKVTLKNDGQRALNFLMVKAEFITGDDLLTEVEKIVVTDKDPMGSEGEPNQKISTTLVPETKLNLHLLKNNQLMVKILLSYREGANQEWKVKAIQEAVVKKYSEFAPSDKPLEPLNAPPVPLPAPASPSSLDAPPTPN